MKDARQHLSEHVSRDRLVLEARRSVRPLTVILIGTAVALLLGAWVLSNVSRTALSSTRELKFAVADATSVVAGRHEVRFKGIPAGSITDVDTDGRQAVITVKVQKKWGPIYRDAKATVRPVTPLEDMYLDIVSRGSKAAGEARADTPIEPSQTATSVDIADVLNTFGADVRERLRSMLNNLGGGLADGGRNLQASFAATVPLVETAGQVTHELAIRARSTRRLVHDTAVLTRELGSRDQQLRRLVTAGGDTFETLQQGRQDLDATLRALPPTLVSLDGSLQAVDGVLPAVNDAATKLEVTARELPDALDGIRDLSRNATPALQALRPAVRRLRPLSAALAPSAKDLDGALGTLRPQVPTFNNLVKDLASCERGVSDFFQLDPAFATLNDSRGPIMRADLTQGLGVAGQVSDPRYYFSKSCVGGTTLGARPATAKDFG